MQVYQGDCSGDQGDGDCGSDGDQVYQGDWRMIRSSFMILNQYSLIFISAVTFQYLFAVTLLWGGTGEWGGLPGGKLICLFVLWRRIFFLKIHKLLLNPMNRRLCWDLNTWLVLTPGELRNISSKSVVIACKFHLSSEYTLSGRFTTIHSTL